MPTALLPQLAQLVLSLHQCGQAWVATAHADAHPEVLPVHCVHVANRYCLWAHGCGPLEHSPNTHDTGILLLSHEAETQDCHLSWIGKLQTMSPQEPLYQQAWSALCQAVRRDAQAAPRWLMQLQPQYGRISRSGETDVALSAGDLIRLLHWPEAA